MFSFQDGSCNGLQHYAALGKDKVSSCLNNSAALLKIVLFGMENYLIFG